MIIFAQYDLTITSSNDDPFNKKAEWKKEVTKSTASFACSFHTNYEHRIYSNTHVWTWKLAQGIWAAIQTILSLGLALISEYTRRSWQQAINGKEWAVVHVKTGGGGVGVPVGPTGGTTIGSSTTPVNPPRTPLPIPPVVPGGTEPVKPPVVEGVAGVKKPAKITKGDVASANDVDIARFPVDLQGFCAADRKLYNQIEEAFRGIDSIENNVGKVNAGKVNDRWAKLIPIDDLLKVYDQILAEYQKPSYQQADGFDSYEDNYLFALKPGNGPVKPYFALESAHPASGYSKRYRSLVGLGALIKCGAEILDEITEAMFDPCRERHPAGLGLQKMYHLTGNTVDLEWPLFKASRYANPFTHDDRATLQAKKLIDAYKVRFADHKHKFLARNLDRWQTPVHDANGHNNHLDRGNFAVWKRAVSNSEFQYFANVPNVPIIVSALLRGPLYFVQSYLILKNSGKSLAPLFDDGALSMKCFNHKLEASEEFNLTCRKSIRLKTPKDFAAEAYGKAAVETALTFNDIDALIQDKAILPPEVEIARLKEIKSIPNDVAHMKERNAAYTEWEKSTRTAHADAVQKWKPNAIKEYLKKAESYGWTNVLYHDAVNDTYKPFDRSVIEDLVTEMIETERADSQGSITSVRFL